MSIKKKKTDTKSGCSHGSAYWENAAKQIPYAVNIPERYISVPEPELEQAAQMLMVQHFTNNGFHIQSCIPDGSRTKVFDPEIRLKKAPPKPASSVKYPVGTKFLVQSDGSKLIVALIDGTKYTLNYLNRNKPDLVVQEKDIDKSTSWNFWIRQRGSL